MTFTLSGNSIELFKPSLKAILVVGVFHGDEPQGDYLIRKYLKLYPDTNLMMVPCLNPDGMKMQTRINAAGVDLNRNFPSSNWEISEKNEYYGGDYPCSEIETRFLVDTVEKYSPRAILTLHAPYRLVNYDGDCEAEMLAYKIAKIIGYPVQKNIGYPTPGSFGTWAGIDNKIPVVTLELDEKVSLLNLEKPVFGIFKMLESY